MHLTRHVIHSSAPKQLSETEVAEGEIWITEVDHIFLISFSLLSFPFLVFKSSELPSPA